MQVSLGKKYKKMYKNIDIVKKITKPIKILELSEIIGYNKKS